MHLSNIAEPPSPSRRSLRSLGQDDRSVRLIDARLDSCASVYYVRVYAALQQLRSTITSPSSYYLQLSSSGGNLGNMPHLSLLAAPANPRTNFVGVRDAAVGGRVGAEGGLRGIQSSGRSGTTVFVVVKLVETVLFDKGGCELVADTVVEEGGDQRPLGEGEKGSRRTSWWQARDRRRRSRYTSRTGLLKSDRCQHTDPADQVPV